MCLVKLIFCSLFFAVLCRSNEHLKKIMQTLTLCRANSGDHHFPRNEVSMVMEFIGGGTLQYILLVFAEGNLCVQRSASQAAQTISTGGCSSIGVANCKRNANSSFQ